MQFDRGYLSPYFITNADKMLTELGEPVHPDPREEAVFAAGDAADPRGGRSVDASLGDHRRGRRGRGAGDVGRQQAARRPQGRRRQGAGLRRSPQGDARGHRGADRWPDDLGRPRHQAGERHARHALHRQAHRAVEGEHDDHRRRRRQARDHRPLRPDPRADRGDLVGLRPREAAGASGEARRRCRGDQGGRGDRGRGQGAQGPGRGRLELDPGGGRGGRRHRRRRGSSVRQPRARQGGAENADQKVGVDIVRRALQAPLRQIAENTGHDGAVVAGKLLESKDASRGFDAQEEKYVDMYKAGIVDPTKVVRIALQDAASIAGLLVTTEAMVADKPEKKDAMPGGAPTWAVWAAWVAEWASKPSFRHRRSRAALTSAALFRWRGGRPASRQTKGASKHGGRPSSFARPDLRAGLLWSSPVRRPSCSRSPCRPAPSRWRCGAASSLRALRVRDRW